MPSFTPNCTIPKRKGTLCVFIATGVMNSRYIRLVSSYEQLGASLILPRSARYGYNDRAWMTWSAVDHMKTWPTGKWARDHQYPPHLSRPLRHACRLWWRPPRAVSCWRASSCGSGQSRTSWSSPDTAMALGVKEDEVESEDESETSNLALTADDATVTSSPRRWMAGYELVRPSRPREPRRIEIRRV